MQSVSNVVGPSNDALRSTQWRSKFRALVACICLFGFLSAVIAVSDSRFSVRKSHARGHNCKILKGCLDSENESRKVPAALIVESRSECAVPVLLVFASVAAQAVVPVRLSSLIPEQGRAPPSQPA